jgi:hypothetical protein
MILNIFSVVSLIALYLSNGKDSNGKNIWINDLKIKIKEMTL